MTDDELKAIEARAAKGINYVTVAPNSDWPDSSAEQADDDRGPLVAEVRRLRGLIADTQDRNGYQRSHGYGDECPWCPYGRLIKAGPNEGDYIEEHIDCPALNPDGSIK